MKKPIPNPTDPTEAQLQALIAQCHDIVSALLVPAAATTDDRVDRIQYVRSAMEIIKTGAEVGDSIARLRGGGVNQHRQHITVERINAASTADGEGE
jgi:hypothetical protein